MDMHRVHRHHVHVGDVQCFGAIDARGRRQWPHSGGGGAGRGGWGFGVESLTARLPVQGG